ncbi:MAG: methyltransferase [Ruminococcaceae bacterium]|nr:methyltransferase [Oscillospiraceae bacterium]
MFRKIPFVEAELQQIGTRPSMMGLGTSPVYNTPVTPRANFDAMYDDRHPYWMPSVRETIALRPALYTNTLGRGSREDITDVFGVRWRYEPVAGGSIAVSGNPLLLDANDWREKIKLPDIDAWDWAACARENPVDPRFPCFMSFANGFWFERLISFMDFMPAAMALIDDDQIEAVRELFDAMTDLGCRLVDKFCEYFPMVDILEVHDDWGAQKAPFFSEEVARDLFVPFMKRLTDRIHAWGRHAQLHSCGHNYDRVSCYIDGGFDMWAPQPMNDIESLYDNYGDKIILCVFPKETDLAFRSEEDQRACARAFVDRYTQPGKPVLLGMEAFRRATPAFDDEVYRYSREVYLRQA